MDNENPVAVSQNLIRSLRGIIESTSKSRKETIITMIATNLTYDDPGMFMKSLVCDERDRHIQDATVIWLINQIIWMSNEPQLITKRYLFN